MGKTYHTKKTFKQKMDEIRQSRERQSSATHVTILSTLNQHDKACKKAKANYSRHPSGTNAFGLRHEKGRERLVKYIRNRFGDAEEQSSRLRLLRKAVNHSIRLKSKRDLHKLLSGLGVES